MPFQIIRADITKIRCDAIVNPTNEDLYPTGGVDTQIHKGAGEDLLKMSQQLGGLQVGQVKITPAYHLPCKLVIHTVGPWWKGGVFGEKEKLQSCYREALKVAKGAKCESIAFPLISSGDYGYPKEQVLKVAIEVIKEFLYENDMLVYIVVYEKNSYSLSEALHDGVASYINDNYLDERADGNERDEHLEECALLTDDEVGAHLVESASIDDGWRKRQKRSSLPNGCVYSSCEETCLPPRRRPLFRSVRDIEQDMEKGFRETLFDFIDEKHLDEVDCYKRANVSRQTWHKIVSFPSYMPKKNTAIALAISLRLTMEETQKLLATVGYTLSKSCLFDVIIMYCITEGIYDVFEIDAVLFHYDQETLFSKE